MASYLRGARPTPLTFPRVPVHEPGQGPGRQVLRAGRAAPGSCGENGCYAKPFEHRGVFDEFIVKNRSFYFSFSAKEEEKQKLLKWSSDLKQEREQLEQKVKQLSSSISVSEAPALVRPRPGPPVCVTGPRPPRLRQPLSLVTVCWGGCEVCLQAESGPPSRGPVVPGASATPWSVLLALV